MQVCPFVLWWIRPCVKFPQDKVKLNDMLRGKPPRIWKALDEASTSRTSIGSSYCVSYDGMPPLFYNLPQAQAGHPMMVPKPEIGSSSSQQIHFTNAPRNVDPAGFRTAVGEKTTSEFCISSTICSSCFTSTTSH